MRINADFHAPVALHTSEIGWQASPMAGVERRMLDRIGDELARATSIVRYAPGSVFSAHTHSGGEEFIVLEGVFQDEHGDYPAGTYVRNPIGTHHIPRSDPGCTIFVKLWQFDADDQEQFSIDLGLLSAKLERSSEGISRAILSNRNNELVVLEEWQAGAERALFDDGGVEMLILEGALDFAGETYAVHDWIRIPAGQRALAVAGEEGARVWVKTRHLRNVKAPPLTT